MNSQGVTFSILVRNHTHNQYSTGLLGSWGRIRQAKIVRGMLLYLYVSHLWLWGDDYFSAECKYNKCTLHFV